MAWFKVDGSLWGNPKTIQVSLAALGLWTLAGSWAARYKTLGAIPSFMLDHFAATEALAAELVNAGLWHETDDGYRFHQWRSHQDGDYRPNIPPAVRAAVMERDGHRCVFCSSTERLSLDHIIRYRDDGPDTVENLRVLCMPCNTERG